MVWRKAFAALATKVAKDADEVWLAEEARAKDLLAAALTKVGKTDDIRALTSIFVRVCELILAALEQKPPSEDSKPAISELLGPTAFIFLIPSDAYGLKDLPSHSLIKLTKLIDLTGRGST